MWRWSRLTKSLFELLSLSLSPYLSQTHTYTHTVIKQVRDKLCREITDQSVLKAWQQGTVCLISSHPQAVKCYQLLSCSELIRDAQSSGSLSLWLSHSSSLSQSPSSIVSISFAHMFPLSQLIPSFHHFLTPNLPCSCSTSTTSSLSLQSSLSLTQYSSKSIYYFNVEINENVIYIELYEIGYSMHYK